MTARRDQRLSKPLATGFETPFKPLALGELKPLEIDGQAVPMFAMLDGAPVAVLALDDYRRLFGAALRGLRAEASEAAEPKLRRMASTIERDPEVAACLREGIGRHLTLGQLRAACVARFGEARAPSLTRISKFRLSKR